MATRTVRPSLLAAVSFITAVSSAIVPRISLAAEAVRSVVVWPTLTPAGDGSSQVPLHKPTETEQAIAPRAQELDATLRDAVQDLGFTLDVADSGPTTGHTRDSDLVSRASQKGTRSSEGTWVVSARIEQVSRATFIVRLVAVPPRGRELRVRVETVDGVDVSARGLVMLRDLLSPSAATEAEASERERQRAFELANLGTLAATRSPGRAVLATNAAVFGAFTALSLQRSSGSDDPRLLFPLLALGTGIGIGSALLASDEWDISTGAAWYLSAGAWWGVGSGIAVANGRGLQPFSDRYVWGVTGGTAGLALATLALTRTKIDDGDAVLAHSGAALGFAMGAGLEQAISGSLDTKPSTGPGYGAAIGLVAAGALALKVETSPSRVLLVDLGAGLGALGGAALASPLLFDDVTENKTRAFLAASLAGTIAGGTTAWILTRSGVSKEPRTHAYHRKRWFSVAPSGGVIGSTTYQNKTMPAYGLGCSGTF